MMKLIAWKRLTAGMLAALCALAAPAAARAEISLPSATPAPAAVAASAIEDDGVVRVYLKSLDAPDQLNLALDGVYTVEHDAGFRFAQGTRIVLSDGGDGVWLSVGGLTLDMGAALTLTRQAGAAEENGLRISETGRNTLYEGDLTVSREEGGGLRAVLSISMEDYLKGVVAYEMSDSWPLEALKAQAVAARTYAMRGKWNAGTRDYDLVDTTADQVFKGYNAEYENVAEAVRATEGVVGVWNGGFATCYYTASNGGETALPSDVWSGGGDTGYLSRREDPYDLENPNSMVSSISFAPGANDAPELRAMLEEGLRAAAQGEGVDPDGLELEEILSIEPTDPVAEGSRMCRKLRFTVTASAPATVFAPGADDVGAPRAPDERPSANLALYAIDYLRRLLMQSPYVETQQRVVLERTFAVDLDVYSQIKDGLGLSLNGGDYEVVSATKDVFGFTIEMRRFGHGVGMSQRGAQRMAGTHGKSWIEILNFYYPGMTLEKIEWKTPELQALDALPDSVGRARPDPTPTPTPAPLPSPEAGEYVATVTLDDAGSSMNVRREPTTQAPVVARVGSGRQVLVCSAEDGEGWVRIRTAEFEGYAKLEYLTKD